MALLRYRVPSGYLTIPVPGPSTASVMWNAVPFPSVLSTAIVPP